MRNPFEAFLPVLKMPYTFPSSIKLSGELELSNFNGAVSSLYGPKPESFNL